MPFASGTGVTHIIASLKTISDDGKFEINTLLRDPVNQPEYTLRAVIDRCSPPFGHLSAASETSLRRPRRAGHRHRRNLTADPCPLELIQLS